jgi:uncharacterized RDD family membrane protein YckC
MSEPTGTQYGGFWIRFLALLADSAIVFVLSTALLVGATMALAPDDMTVAVIAVWALGFLYWPILHASRLRATFGKAILGLYVTRFDGRRISILRALWREVAKIFSGAVFMLGYVIAAVTPRKQALHDLMAATYVAREGVSRIFPALLVVLAGFATPVFVAPMVVDRAVQSAMEKVVMDAIAQYDPMKQPTRPAAPAMKVAPRNPAPAPAPVAKVPAPAKVETPVPAKVEAPGPKPAPVALAQPAPVAEPAKAVTEPQKPAAEPVKTVNEPVKTVTEPAKTVKESVKPKAAAAKQKQGPGPTVVRAAARPSPTSSDFMLGSGPKYNDLMTAVLARDVAAVNELLRLGKWVDKPDSRGRTPLMVATAQDDVPTAEALLRGGASPRPAVRVAEERGNGEMVALLKRYGSR